MGCAQREGIDYNEVYAPVAKHTTMRALLAKAVAEGLHVHQLDVKTAFLNGDLEEDIWMQQPPGFSVDGGLACHLKKSLYGLKQAPRAWNKRLTEELESQGFVVSDADPCLFIRHLKDDTLFLLVWVDDILLVAGNEKNILSIKDNLSKEFALHDLGPVKRHLGMEVHRDWDSCTLTLSQKHLTSELVAKFGLEDAKGRDIPLSPAVKLTTARSEE